MTPRQVAYQSEYSVDSYNSKIDLRGRVRGEEKKETLPLREDVMLFVLANLYNHLDRWIDI